MCAEVTAFGIPASAARFCRPRSQRLALRFDFRDRTLCRKERALAAEEGQVADCLDELIVARRDQRVIVLRRAGNQPQQQ